MAIFTSTSLSVLLSLQRQARHVYISHLGKKNQPVFQLTFLRKIGYVSRQSCLINYYEGYTRQGSDFNSGCPKMLG